MVTKYLWLTAAIAVSSGAALAQAPDKPTRESAAQMVENWPKSAQHAATQMIEKYGAPAEATPSQLTWFDNGPWKRTIVQKEETDHAFPMPHKDLMLQVVSYEIPEDKVDEFAMYDGSVYADRTRGELSARCDMEAANFVALNLANDIATGKRSVEDARAHYPKAMMAHLEKKPTPYSQGLMFSAKGRTADPDKTTISKAELQKATELKEAMMAAMEAEAERK